MKSVRLRLLILALLPLVVVMPLLLMAGMNRWSTQFDALLITNVESDLRIAEQYLQRILTINGNDVQALARSVEFQEALSDEAELDAVLSRYQDRLDLDFLVYLPAAMAEAEAVKWPVIATALAGGGRRRRLIFSDAMICWRCRRGWLIKRKFR